MLKVQIQFKSSSLDDHLKANFRYLFSKEALWCFGSFMEVWKDLKENMPPLLFCSLLWVQLQQLSSVIFSTCRCTNHTMGTRYFKRKPSLKKTSDELARLKSLLVYKVKSLMSEATPSATHSFKRSKLAIIPNYKHSQMLC